MSATRDLVAHCHQLGRQPLPGPVASYARSLLLDFLGVAAAGAALEESSHAARRVAEAIGGAEEASAFGIHGRLPAAMAAFVNGVSAHGVEMDDTHSRASAHPGAVVWPAALAIAEREGLSGAALLPAVAAGYELACRVGCAASPPSLYRRGFHPTSTSGVFGAALAAACLLDLPLEATLNSIGVAGSFASGNMEYLAQGTWTKRVQPGQAAQGGVIAALLAGEGFRGPATVLEGDFGFLHAYSDAGDVAALTDGLGERWEIVETGIKVFACCRYMHSPIEAALRAAGSGSWAPQEVETIQVGLVSPGWGLVAEPLDAKYAPQTRVDAQFSLPFGVATALVHGRAMATEFREAQLADPTILALARKVTVHHDEALDREYPAHWPSWCRIVLGDGRTLRGQVNTTKGDPENPLAPEEVRAKFDLLAGMAWDARASQRIVAAVEDLDERPVRELMDFARQVSGQVEADS